MDMTNIFEIVISLVFAVMTVLSTYYVRPLLKQFISNKNNQQLVEMTKILIKTAEQLYLNGAFDTAIDAAKAKKDYVMNSLKIALAKEGITFDEKYLSDVVEGLIKNAKEEFYYNDLTIQESKEIVSKKKI